MRQLSNWTRESSDTESASLTRRRILKTSAGAAATAIAVPAASGVAAAHFHGPDKSAINIDIKPESDTNRIDLQSQGVVPVAVLPTEEFDPTNENVNYRFGAPNVVEQGGGARPLHDGHIKDVDGDGNCDLVLHFPVENTEFDGDEEVGALHWEKGKEGAHHGLGGSDHVTIVGAENAAQSRTKRTTQSQRSLQKGWLQTLFAYLG